MISSSKIFNFYFYFSFSSFCYYLRRISFSISSSRVSNCLSSSSSTFENCFYYFIELFFKIFMIGFYFSTFYSLIYSFLTGPSLWMPPNTFDSVSGIFATYYYPFFTDYSWLSEIDFENRFKPWFGKTNIDWLLDCCFCVSCSFFIVSYFFSPKREVLPILVPNIGLPVGNYLSYFFGVFYFFWFSVELEAWPKRLPDWLELENIFWLEDWLPDKKFDFDYPSFPNEGNKNGCFCYCLGWL